MSIRPLQSNKEASKEQLKMREASEMHYNEVLLKQGSKSQEASGDVEILEGFNVILVKKRVL